MDSEIAAIILTTNSAFANSASIKAPAIWDHLARQGKKSIIVGVPPNYPPRRVNGISIGCFLTPDTVKNDFTYPPEHQIKINALVGEYPTDVKNFRTNNKDWLKNRFSSMSRKQWQVVRWLLKENEWDYFHFVDIGLDRMHHGFWNYFDPTHVQFQPGNPYQNAIPEYYLWLDEQIGAVLELLDKDTIVLVVSDHGAQRLDGGFAINEWLIREGLLVLEEYPADADSIRKTARELEQDSGVERRRILCARVLQRRRDASRKGVIPANDYERFQDEMKTRLEALPDDKGAPMKSLVFKPKEALSARSKCRARSDRALRRTVLAFDRNGWARKVHVQENDTGPDACNHAQYGMFILDRSELFATRGVRRRTAARYCPDANGSRWAMKFRRACKGVRCCGSQRRKSQTTKDTK